MSVLVAQIWEKFHDLPLARGSAAVNAVQCTIKNTHLLIKGQDGEPVLLVHALPRVCPRTPIRLKHLSITFDLTCEVHDSSAGLITGTFTRFSCSPASANLHKYFIDIIIAATLCEGEPAQESMVDEQVSAILELFRQFSAPPRTTVVGLWGELLTIFASDKVESFVRGWHNELSEAFDFSFEGVRLEVKATEKRIREHDFSLRQVESARPGDFVVSILVSRNASGYTVFDLLDEICVKLPFELSEKIIRIALETLGEDSELADGHRFELSSAVQSICFLRADKVPSPTIDSALSDFISNVRFQSNISLACRQFGSSNYPS